MQDIDRFFEPDRVDGSVGVALKIIDELQDPCRAETLKHFGSRMLGAPLSEIEGVTHEPHDLRRHLQEILL